MEWKEIERTERKWKEMKRNGMEITGKPCKEMKRNGTE
jgi:hypothetical protein